MKYEMTLPLKEWGMKAVILVFSPTIAPLDVAISDFILLPWR